VSSEEVATTGVEPEPARCGDIARDGEKTAVSKIIVNPLIAVKKDILRMAASPDGSIDHVSNKKAALPRATLTKIALGSPAVFLRDPRLSAPVSRQVWLWIPQLL
jgi:hypothetical protein